MTLWSAVLLVAAGSYALRLTPLLLGAGLRDQPRPPRTRCAMPAPAGSPRLLVAATVSLSSASTGPGPLAVVVAVLVAGWVARTGRSMTVVVLAGAAAHALIIAIVALAYAMSATAMTIGSETTEAMEVTVVRVLKVPWVDSPSSDLNIQKKLLLT